MSPPTSKGCTSYVPWMPPAFLDAILHRARIPSCPPRAFLKSLPLLPRAACPNRPSLAPLSVLSSTACASSATTCSASLLTDLMPSNAPPVTRDDPHLLPFRFLPYLRARLRLPVTFPRRLRSTLSALFCPVLPNSVRGPSMIEARGLSKRFQDKTRGEIRAVDNVSFTCQPG